MMDVNVQDFRQLYAEKSAQCVALEAALKKIADHCTQLPCAECARIAREALEEKDG